MDQDLRDVDLDRAHFVAGAAQRRRVRQRLRVFQTLQLRREDRADRTAVDRPVGVAAGLAVDRAAFRHAAQRMQCSVSRASRVGQDFVRPLSSRTTWNSSGPSPGVTPVQIELYGFIRSPGRRARAAAAGTPRDPGSVGTTFSMPAMRDQHLRQGQAHPAVALRLDDADAAGIGDQEVRAAEADPDPQELLAQEPRAPRWSGPRARRRARRAACRRRKMSRISARFRCSAGTTMCDGRSWPS